MQLSSRAASLAVTLLFAVSLAACGRSQEEGDTSRPAYTGGLIEKKEIEDGAIFATFDPSMGYASMQDAAKVACNDEPICKVIIFRPGTPLPTQFPMTTREASEVIGSYTLNRTTGADELLASCGVVAETPRKSCSAVEL